MKLKILVSFTLFFSFSALAVVSCEDFSEAVYKATSTENLSDITTMLNNGSDPNCSNGFPLAQAAIGMDSFRATDKVLNYLFLRGATTNSATAALSLTHPEAAIHLIRKGARVDEPSNPYIFSFFYRYFDDVTVDSTFEPEKLNIFINECIALGSLKNLQVRNKTFNDTMIIRVLETVGSLKKKKRIPDIEKQAWMVISNLLKHGATLNNTIGRVWSSSSYFDVDHELNMTIKDRSYFLAEKLILAGADVNYRSSENWSFPLDLAAEDSRMVTLLLDHGADPFKGDKHYILETQISNAKIDLVKRLLNSGIHIDNRRNSSLSSPLFWAVQHTDSYLELLSLFKRYNVNFNAVSETFGHNFIQHLVDYSSHSYYELKMNEKARIRSIIEYLLDNGLNIDHVDTYRLETVMHTLTEATVWDDKYLSDVVTIANILLKFKPNLKIKNSYGYTPCDKLRHERQKYLLDMLNAAGGCQ